MMTLTPRMLVAALAPALALTGFVAPAAASASVQAPLIWDCPSYGDDPYIPPATYVPVFCAQPRVGQDTDIFLGLPTDDEIRYRTSIEGEWLVDGVSVRRGVNRYAPRAEDMGKLIQFRLHVHGTRNGQPWY